MDLSGSRQPQALRLLFWLKLKLTLRGYQRDNTALAGVVIALLAFLPLTALAAIGSYLGYISLPPPYPEHLLRAVLLGTYLFWLVSPLMGFAVNESFDVTKLFVYPITVRQILFGAIAGSILDFPVLFLLPSLMAALVAFSSGGESAVLAAAALLLFLAHTLALGQSIVLATSGMLRSRRYRDLLMVLIPLVWIVYYVVQEMMRRGSLQIDWKGAVTSRTWELASFLPPGMAARAVTAAGEGDLLTATGWCALLAALTIATVALASVVIQKVYAGETEVVRLRAKGSAGDASLLPAPVAAVETGKERLPFGLRLSPAAEAVYLKEARYMRRDPSFKAAFMNLLYMLVVAIFMVLPQQGRGFPMRWMVWPATFVVLMSEMRFFFNLFGTEGAAASLFFLFPASRRDMLVGKNTVYLVMSLPVNLLLGAVLCIVPNATAELPYILLWMLLATGFFLAAGDLMSIFFPMRVVMRGWKVRQMSVGSGCAYGFLYLAISLATLIALIPVIAAILLPRIWLGEVWLAITLPLAVVYVAGAYLLSLKLGERFLLERELNIVQKLTGEES